MWFTGLYAAGRSANTGMHGDGYLPGNLQLEDLVTGEAAGNHAGEWVKTTQFGGSNNISRELTKVSQKIEAYYSPTGTSVGEVSKKLSGLAKKINEGSNSSLSSIKELKDIQISLTDDSKVMNTELLRAIQTDAMFSIVESLAKTS
jgi:succinate dehydrogenase/fumarate reductase flavoprotein subunit